jgi:hypothetical protein
MPSKEVEELFHNLALVHRVASVAEAKANRKARISRFFNRERIREMFKKSEPKPRSAGSYRRETVKAPFTARKHDHRGDLTVAALGITLGLTCALFPWYIFYNPEQFGVRAMKFSRAGAAGQTGPITLGSQPERIGAPSEVPEIPPAKLDLFATGTTQKDDSYPDKGTPGLAAQPFPPELLDFRLLHIANGRAMIEDDAGIFIVQRGSILPDNSRVAAIEERSGAFVLVTTGDRVIEVSR